MKLVVGLGNPEARYAPSRHNVGFRILDVLAERWGIELSVSRFRGRYGSASPAVFAGEAVGLLAPETWMNGSGDAVFDALEELSDVDPARDLAVIYDDLDLPFGQLRIRPQGGGGGHNGLAHIIERLAERELDRVPRLRFGVGRPPAGRETADYVLEPFAAAEEAALPAHLQRAAEAVERLLVAGPGPAMTEFNRLSEDPLGELES